MYDKQYERLKRYIKEVTGKDVKTWIAGRSKYTYGSVDMANYVLNSTFLESIGDLHDLFESLDDTKLDKLTAGDGIEISDDNVISATISPDNYYTKEETYNKDEIDESLANKLETISTSATAPLVLSVSNSGTEAVISGSLDSTVATSVETNALAPLNLEASIEDSKLSIEGSVDLVNVLQDGALDANSFRILLYLAKIYKPFSYIYTGELTPLNYHNESQPNYTRYIVWLSSTYYGEEVKLFASAYPETGTDQFFTSWPAVSSTSCLDCGDWDSVDEYMKSAGVSGAVLLDRLFYCLADEKYYYWNGSDLVEFDVPPEYATVSELNSAVDSLESKLDSAVDSLNIYADLAALRSNYPSDTLIDNISNWISVTGDTNHANFTKAVIMDTDSLMSAGGYCRVRFLANSGSNDYFGIHVWNNTDKEYLIAEGMAYHSGTYWTSIELLIPYSDNKLQELTDKYVCEFYLKL